MSLLLRNCWKRVGRRLGGGVAGCGILYIYIGFVGVGNGNMLHQVRESFYHARNHPPVTFKVFFFFKLKDVY